VALSTRPTATPIGDRPEAEGAVSATVAGVTYLPPHPLDIALANLPAESFGAERLEVIWQYYEAAASTTLKRPPTVSEQEAVHDYLHELRKNENFPVFMERRPRPRVTAALSILEKATFVAQLYCPACTPLVGWKNFPVPVEPWSAQVSNEENQRMKQLVRDYLGDRKLFGAPQAGPLCVSVVTILPRRRNTIDVDNAVKGLLDALAMTVYENDRDIQCLISRRLRNAGDSGFYAVRMAQVEPWEADVVWPDNPEPQRFA
jgi:hypothetical protein